MDARYGMATDAAGLGEKMRAGECDG